ncbi:MAG: hypothetical protein H6811_09600 [Phycisphaeraceae bacterium]|nr:hypothetical protein [Phycisphaeraceae bacterium]
MTRNRSYVNGVLTVIALLLGVLALDRLAGGLGPASAQAQTGRNEPNSGGMVSAADQRKVIIREIKDLRGQIEAMQATLSRGLDVRVTDMPEIKLPKEDR